MQPTETTEHPPVGVSTPRWRARLDRLRDRMPAKLQKALLSKKTLALFLIALIGKLAFYGVLAWQLMIRR